LAADADYVEIFQWLLDEGAEPSLFYNGPFHVAVRGGYLDILNILIAYWRKKLIPDEFRVVLNTALREPEDDKEAEQSVPACETAMYSAARDEHPELVRLLFNEGASIWCHSPQDRVLHYLIREPKFGPLLRDLIKSSLMMAEAFKATINPQINEWFREAVWSGNVEAAKLILEMSNGIKPEPLDHSFLGKVVCDGNLELAELVMRIGVEYSKFTPNYDALECALRERNLEMVKSLLYGSRPQFSADQFAKRIVNKLFDFTRAYSHIIGADSEAALPENILQMAAYMRLYGAEVKWYEVSPGREITPASHFFSDHCKQISEEIKKVCQGFDGLALRKECTALRQDMNFRQKGCPTLDRCCFERDGSKVDTTEDYNLSREWEEKFKARNAQGAAAILVLFGSAFGNFLQIGSHESDSSLDGFAFVLVIFCVACVYAVVKKHCATIAENNPPVRGPVRA